MRWLTERKFSYVIGVLLFFLLCIGTAHAESSIPDADDSTGPSRFAADYTVSGIYRPSATPVVATIETLVGEAVVLRDKGKSGFTARQGDAVHLGDAIFTDAESSLRLKFKNMDIAIMGASTNLHIDTYQDDTAKQQKIARLKSSSGNLLFYVLRLFGYRKIQFEVQTPSRVASVRGTKFGVSVTGTRGDHVAWLMAGAPMQTMGNTDCFCDSGSVVIDKSIVHGGIIYRGRDRAIDLLTVNDTEQFLRSFQHPLVPRIVHAITPPGHDRSRGRGPRDKVTGLKRNGPEGRAVGHTKEKNARKIKDKTNNKGGKGKKKGHSK